MDLFEAVDLAVQLEMAINEMRMNAGEEFAQLFGTIQTVCQKLNIDMCVPRLTSRQTHRSNIPLQAPEDFYRATVYIPFVDSFLLQLKERLTDQKALLLSFKCLIPTVSADKPTEADEQNLRQQCTRCMQTCYIAVNYPLLVSNVCGTVVSVTQLQRTRERRL